MQCMPAAEAVLDAWHRISYGVTDAELDEAKNRLIKKLLTKLNSMYFSLSPVCGLTFKLDKKNHIFISNNSRYTR